MISMQRSLSSPAYNHPVSPNVTVPSRSPSPTPDSRSLQPPRRHRSRSPVHSAPPPESADTSPARQNDVQKPRDEGVTQDLGTSVPQKPLVAQVSAQPKPKPSPKVQNRAPIITSSTKEETAFRQSPTPLLDDVSLYTNNFVNTEDEGTTLEKLAHEVRLSKYQERKRANTRIRLQRNLISTALSSRLTRCGEIAQRNLAELFRTGETHTFARLFDAIQDVRNSCDATRRFALLEPDMESLRSPGMASSDTLDQPPSVAGSISGTAVTPFLADLSPIAHDTILNFLTQLRTNPDFLASRLCALSTTELRALTVFHQGMEPIESVLPFYTLSQSSSNANKSSAAALTAVERLLSFQRHDPLSGLIYTCFANSAGPNSAEDKKRTQVWATACSRLIQTATFEYENVLVAIINVWSTMRDWAGRSNMEWYIMKILEEGAFLLDKAQDPQGTRFAHISDWNDKDSLAASEFYDRAVDELFAIVDDEDATGIPEGVLELGNEVLRHLEKSGSPARIVTTTRNWFVWKWLFSNWLLGVVVHPESFGMMAEYNITEYGRQKILKEVVMRAQQIVNDMLVPPTNLAGHPVSTPLKPKKHIENLVNRFKPSRIQKTARLLPARSITSLRETAEVHPYLVVSPADILTLANALFPERRPQSAYSGSLRSGAPSVSGFSAISQPISVGASRRDMDSTSVVSMSVSPVRSEATTSYEPLLYQNTGTPQRYSPPFSESATRLPHAYEEEIGRPLRTAMSEMVQSLGSDVVAGTCHPCAERWAVLFVSPDGGKLSVQMIYDPEDDIEEDDTSSGASDGDEYESDEKPELSTDFHELRNSILKLVEDFEIPQGEDSSSQLSNRASRLTKYVSKNKVITSEKTMGSRNPYRKEAEPVLIAMLTAAAQQPRTKEMDYAGTHSYWKTLHQLNSLSSPSLRKNGYSSLLHIFARGPRDSLRRSASALEEYEAWIIWLKQSMERHEGLIDNMMKRIKALRDKMWYTTDVRTSEVYEHCRHLCSALKIMGVPRKSGEYQNSRAQLLRNPTLSFIHKQESQMLGLLAATEEQGGPNKLTDDQVEKTNKWIKESHVKNLCPGEERIHRLCCEIDNCLGRLVSDSVTSSPVLWSSPLYNRDKNMFDGPRRTRDRESSYGADDASSIISSEYNRRYTTSSSSNRAGSVIRDLHHNRSQISIGSGRNSLSRASTAASDIMDAREYFGHSSPVQSIDSATTFWSPFHSTMSAASSATSRAQSPTGSVANLPGLFSHPYQHSLPSTVSFAQNDRIASPTESILQQRLSEEKQRFLADLRQTLLSLLLSDFGNFVYAYGSETDLWLNELGQECLDLRPTEEPAVQRPSRAQDTATKQPKPRALEKKKSSTNLRDGRDSPLAGPSLNRHDSPSTRSRNSAATNDTVSPRVAAFRKDEPTPFPYKKAYQRLLRMFSVHPNPYTKLNALYELERLISASISSGGRRSRLVARSNPSSNDDFGSSGKHDQSNKEKRPTTSHAASSPNVITRSALNAETRSIAPAPKGYQEAIRKELQSLLRDPDIRPKTLFRDLQFISAFVPSSVLDLDRNDAYFDTMVAAVSLKKEIISTMVEVADGVVARSNSSNPNADIPDPETTYLRGALYSSSLPTAARMLTIAAKEGHSTAQRELGLFQLSNPELVPRVTLPLTKPRDVFKQAVMEKFGSGSAARGGNTGRSSSSFPAGLAGLGVGGGAGGMSGLGGGPGGIVGVGADGDIKRDPAIFCVAWHWMERAQKGGDALASQFISQDSEMWS
ncbi:hypothetical protein F5Y16DRAFT_331790 [Xylariaceae sp. FL0255]|nr:hypothetical protein F5Y16DRAFT_331790 [Xylariaceae sp. FL0255]